VPLKTKQKIPKTVLNRTQPKLKKKTTMTTKGACDVTHDLLLPLLLCVCVYVSQAVMLFSPVGRSLFIYAYV